MYNQQKGYLSTKLDTLQVNIEPIQHKSNMKETVGERIRTLKNKKNVTFLEMSKSLNVSTQTLQAWMNNKTEPSPRHIHALSEFFLVHPSHFITGDRIEIFGTNNSDKSAIITDVNTVFKLKDGQLVLQVPFIKQDEHDNFVGNVIKKDLILSHSFFTYIGSPEDANSIIAVQVRGDGMYSDIYDSFKAGSIVIAKEVIRDNVEIDLPLTRWPYYLLVTTNGLLFTQVIGHNKQEKTLSCLSINPDKLKYPKREISLSKCQKVYYVTQAIRSTEL